MLKLLLLIVTLIASFQAVSSAHFSGYATFNLGSSMTKRDNTKGKKQDSDYTDGSDSSNDSSSSFSGDGTFFTPDHDACSKSGKTSSTGDLIAALSHYQFNQKSGQDTDQASSCGRCVKVSGPSGSVVVRIQDLCASCSSGDIDMTPSAFEHIAPKVAGRVKVVWKQVSCNK
ncbi:hypothetical protein K7432_012123 [Basidiobolus ranarum]|uniref:RlpA-like protein double-psi beta-barrel domain-containing protein n=1 Tax=Basidiobolus ranarum TaxID=34480 RepID=A0ABR2WLB4_9FUNG